jgi:hypothetical protein
MLSVVKQKVIMPSAVTKRNQCCKQFYGSHDTQHSDIQHNDTQHNDIQHNDIQHNDIHHNNKKIMTLSTTTLSIMAEFQWIETLKLRIIKMAYLIIKTEM